MGSLPRRVNMKSLVLLALTSAALAAPQQQGNKRFIGGIGGIGGVPHGGIGGVHPGGIGGIHGGIGGVHPGVHPGGIGGVHGAFPGNVHGGIGAIHGGIGGVGIGGYPGGYPGAGIGIGGIGANNIGGNPGGIPQGNILGLPCKKFAPRPDPITGQYLCADSIDDALINQGISQNNGGLPHNAGGGLFPGGFGR